MSGRLLAHSARPNRGISAQPFWDHIQRVAGAAVRSARHAAHFWIGEREAFCADVEAAARFHDCGKLAPENQAVLARSSKDRLEVRHEDAGAALLMEKQQERAALLVASHHAGLPSRSEEKAKHLFKPPSAMYRFAGAIHHTSQHRTTYLAEYENAGLANVPIVNASDKWSGLTHRFGLSCLVDADHSDTARHYGEPLPKDPPKCRWAERAAALDRFVERLSAARSDDLRNEDRRRVYDCCCEARPDRGIVSCDAAVGSGKTTAIMAHLLRVAEQHEFRHVFVVLPYTNIIEQSVDVYRRALALPGEDPTEVVAAVHHRAEFQNPESREMSVLWGAPITVTTAVQFFETLADNKPSRLRKLHELPGSAVFVDEAHAAIPIWLWPQTWLWLRELTRDWSCHFVLASGSLAKFWENPEIVRPAESVPDLLTSEVRARLAAEEKRRIQIHVEAAVMNCEDLTRFVTEKAGPRLVILNTVQSAAVFADSMRGKGHDVLHLSTALSPDDRARIAERVKARLSDRNSTKWTLVATSCVEAGVDYSFRTAIRESCSVASVIQTGGRVNRHNEWASAAVWDVRLQDPMFNAHPAFKDSRIVLAEMLHEGAIGIDVSDTVTEALRRELVRCDVRTKAEDLSKMESLGEFPKVAELYEVINSDTRTVVVDSELRTRLERGERVPWRALLRGSVQIWARNVQKLSIMRFQQHEELYYWTADYDPHFLGYMAGVLPLIRGKEIGLYA
jgi:CRISPR-associated endonuclease/helicase Cas3